MKVVYILSLPRSGSTFLQFLLASRSDVVGMGETALAIKRFGSAGTANAASRPCSCGESPAGCPVWSFLLPSLAELSPLEAHRRILEHFQQLFPERILIDSSKSWQRLETYYLQNPEARNIDLRVVFVVRDFRGWAMSIAKHRRRLGERQHGVLYTSYEWLYGNLKTLRELRRSRIPYLFISYERLIFDMPRTLARISEYLELAYEASSIDMNASTHHDLAGSQMKEDPGRRNRVVYDGSWITDWPLSLGLPALLPVYIANQVLHKPR